MTIPINLVRIRAAIGTLDSAPARSSAAAVMVATLAVIAGPSSAQQDDAFGAINRRVEAVLQKRNLPGATVAISRGGRLLFAGGYGLADREAGQRMTPATLMRIASVSKVVTAIGVLRLVDEHRLDLDAKVFGVLGSPPLPSGAAFDPRIDTITVRQLMQHTAGWQSETRDPFLRELNHDIAEAMNVPLPADCPTVIQYMRGRPLGFDPGTHFAYANLNYCILGRLIERVSGQSYVDYIQEHVLKPSGITRARLARTLLNERLDGEARYYVPAPETPSAISDSGEFVPWPYGGFSIEIMDSFGGLVMSSVDLLRLLAAIEGRRGKAAALSDTLLSQLQAPPPPPASQDAPFYYGLGFWVRPLPDGNAFWLHNGYLPGNLSYVVRSPAGFSAAVLTNGSPPSDGVINVVIGELERALIDGATEIKQWPDEDQFDRFP